MKALNEANALNPHGPVCITVHMANGQEERMDGITGSFVVVGLMPGDGERDALGVKVGVGADAAGIATCIAVLLERAQETGMGDPKTLLMQALVMYAELATASAQLVHERTVNAQHQIVPVMQRWQS